MKLIEVIKKYYTATIIPITGVKAKKNPEPEIISGGGLCRAGAGRGGCQAAHAKRAMTVAT